MRKREKRKEANQKCIKHDFLCEPKKKKKKESHKNDKSILHQKNFMSSIALC